MRKIIIILILNLIWNFITVGQTSPINIISYNINLDYVPLKKRIEVNSILEIEKSDTIDEFILLKDSMIFMESVNAFLDSMPIDVTFKNLGQDSFKLIIPEKLRPYKNIKLNFVYTIPIEAFINGVKLFYNWYPKQIEDLALWNVNAKIPSEYVIFFPGDLKEKRIIENQIVYSYERNISFRRFPMIIAESKAFNYTSTSKVSGKILTFYFTTDDTVRINNIISETSIAFKFYNLLIGEYAYQQLTIVEVPEAQYINSQPSLMIVGSIFVKYIFNLGHNNWPGHEVAHQWIGSGFFPSKFDTKRSCIYEPLAEYMNLMFIENIMGKDTMLVRLQSMLNEYSSKVVGTVNDTPLDDSGPTRVIYLKGPYVMHKLREKLGDEKWKKFLQDIYINYKGEFFTYDNFIEYLLKYDKIENVNLFEKWVSQKGIFLE